MRDISGSSSLRSEILEKVIGNSFLSVIDRNSNHIWLILATKRKHVNQRDRNNHIFWKFEKGKEWESVINKLGEQKPRRKEAERHGQDPGKTPTGNRTR